MKQVIVIQENVFAAISRRRAAQQRTDKRLGGALATFRCRPFFVSSAGQPAAAGQVNGCPFGSFWASKMNIKFSCENVNSTLFITNLPA
jgi:hypothetical protein